MDIDPIDQHFQSALVRAKDQSIDESLVSSAAAFFERSHQLQYSYNFSWLGRPIIQYPQDIVAFQEIVSLVKPEIIVETGIAHGGSLMLSASLLCLLDVMEGLDPRVSPRKVIGVDIDIRAHNKKAIDAHPLRFKIDLIEGSSIDPVTIARVKHLMYSGQPTVVCLDSNHTHDHVFAELNAYAGLTSLNSYCIVFDTVLEDMKNSAWPDRPWDVGNNPKTAVHEWLKSHPEFQIDSSIDEKLLISVAPDGYLKRVST